MPISLIKIGSYLNVEAVPPAYQNDYPPPPIGNAIWFCCCVLILSLMQWNILIILHTLSLYERRNGPWVPHVSPLTTFTIFPFAWNLAILYLGLNAPPIAVAGCPIGWIGQESVDAANIVCSTEVLENIVHCLLWIKWQRVYIPKRYRSNQPSSTFVNHGSESGAENENEEDDSSNGSETDDCIDNEESFIDSCNDCEISDSDNNCGGSCNSSQANLDVVEDQRAVKDCGPHEAEESKSHNSISEDNIEIDKCDAQGVEKNIYSNIYLSNETSKNYKEGEPEKVNDSSNPKGLEDDKAWAEKRAKDTNIRNGSSCCDRNTEITSGAVTESSIGKNIYNCDHIVDSYRESEIKESITINNKSYGGEDEDISIKNRDKDRSTINNENSRAYPVGDNNTVISTSGQNINDDLLGAAQNPKVETNEKLNPDPGPGIRLERVFPILSIVFHSFLAFTISKTSPEISNAEMETPNMSYPGYGCTREVLDPEDPNAEPGAAESYAQHLAELKKAIEISKTPDIPGRLVDEENDASATGAGAHTLAIPPAKDIKPLGETDGNAQSRIYTWSEISENARINSLLTQAALQTVEDDYRAGLLAHGIPLEDAKPLKSHLQDENELGELNRIRAESSNWSKSKSANITNNTRKSPLEASGVKKLVEIVAYQSTPEYHNRSEEVIRLLEAEPITPMVHSNNSDFDLAIDFGDDGQQAAMFLAAKKHEQMESDQRIAAAIQLQADAQKRVAELEKYLGEFPEMERRRQLAEKEQHKRNMAALEARFLKEEQEKRARLEAEERKRVEEEERREEAAKAAEKKRLDAIKAYQEAEKKRKEKEEADKRAKEKAAKQAAEEEQRRRFEESKRQEALNKQKEDEERRKKEESDKLQKAKEAAVRQTTSNEANLQTEALNASQSVASTMRYLVPDTFEELKGSILRSLKQKASYIPVVVRRAPPDLQGTPELQLIAKNLNRYATTRYNMELVLARVKAIKGVFNSSDLSAVKYSLSKRVTQMVGSKSGYLTSATEVLKILNGVAQNLPSNSGETVIVVDDFILPRQKPEGMTAPPALFITLYSFLKIVLVKAAAEGPDKPGTMKALALLLNATLGGKAKYWPCSALTLVIYMRMWEFSPSLFGAMGEPRDIGYRDMDSPTDVNRRAEVTAALWCHMGILRPANVKREQAIVISDVHESLVCNLKVPPFLRDEVHYINIRTIMSIAPWEIRNHIGPQQAIHLVQVIEAFCAEDSNTKLRAFASLLLTQMQTLASAGYLNAAKGWGCDEWKYWDLEELDDTNKKRAGVEAQDPELARVSRDVTRNRVERERMEAQKRLPEESGAF